MRQVQSLRVLDDPAAFALAMLRHSSWASYGVPGADRVDKRLCVDGGEGFGEGVN